MRVSVQVRSGLYDVGDNKASVTCVFRKQIILGWAMKADMRKEMQARNLRNRTRGGGWGTGGRGTGRIGTDLGKGSLVHQHLATTACITHIYTHRGRGRGTAQRARRKAKTAGKTAQATKMRLEALSGRLLSTPYKELRCACQTATGRGSTPHNTCISSTHRAPACRGRCW